MDEIVTAQEADKITAAPQLLHDFNTEYEEPTPGTEACALRLAELIKNGHATVLITREGDTAQAVGVAVLRVQPSVWSKPNEAYLAEIYVVPDRRGQGFGRELITACLDAARDQGADYALVVTSEDDQQAQRLYAAAGFRRTEGDGGPQLMAFERVL